MYLATICALILGACDLQPKIASIPDSIGMFIEDRYPALLANPETQPEIYNSAVTDYGVYASPELYGSENIDDYVLYASVDDYVLIPESEPSNQTPISESVEMQDDTNDEETEIMTDYILVPTYDENAIKDKESVEKPIEKPAQQPIQNSDKNIDKKTDEIIVARGDTVYALAKKNNMSVDEFANLNNLKEPYMLKIGQTLKTHTPKTEIKAEPKPVVKTDVEKKVEKEIPNVISVEKVQQIKSERASAKPAKKATDVKRVDVSEITVATGDTLYSISRKYEIPVNDLAIMNKLSAPFALSVGQKLKVPKLDTVQTRHASEIKKANNKPVVKKSEKNVETPKSAKAQKQTSKSQTDKKQMAVKATEKTKAKISSNPKQSLPKITARSDSKFSWPVRGKILSAYGPKQGGLVNDGINISAQLGATVLVAENGVVAYAGNEIKGMGNLIIIQHADGWMTVYAHLNSMNVRRGNKVTVGQKIGTVGKTGKVDKPQLHFEIRKGTKSYNPMQYLKNK